MRRPTESRMMAVRERPAAEVYRSHSDVGGIRDASENPPFVVSERRAKT
jgi:hypothetical protein